MATMPLYWQFSNVGKSKINKQKPKSSFIQGYYNKIIITENEKNVIIEEHPPTTA